MAKSRKSSSARKGGSTLFGILVGLILGLVAAVGVALFVTKMPMPFSDKASRDPASVLLPNVRDAPDPNIGLYGKDSPAGNVANGPASLGMTPLPGSSSDGNPPPVPAGPDNLGDLIASLTKSQPAERAAAPAPAPVKPPAAASATKPAAPAADSATMAIPGVQTTYYLQAGAFRNASDAEAVMARIVMLGMPAQVQKAQVSGGTVNRVRVGPFKGIDDMNRSRALLGQEKIETSVVRP